VNLTEIVNEIKMGNNKNSNILKRWDNMKNITEGTDGYPYILQTEDGEIDDIKFDNAKSFIEFVMNKLGITNPIKVTMTNNRKRHKLKTFAQFNKDNSHCVVYSKGRNLADVLRSVAHELVHKSQLDNGRLEGEVPDIGGEIEDEANAVAGQLVKEFGYKNPKIFE